MIVATSERPSGRNRPASRTESRPEGRPNDGTLKTIAPLRGYVRLSGVRTILLILAITLAGQAGADNIRPIKLLTRDDLELMAAYYPVATNSAAAVLLLHSYGKSRDEWGSVAQLFQMNGIAVLALDLRGHGESTRRLTVDGVKAVDFRSFGPQDFTNMVLDVNQAYDWLASQPGIDKQRIAVIGSSIGANLALRYAAFNDEVAGLILLSPVLFFRNLRADDVITRFGKRPLCIVASRDDELAYKSSKYLIELRQRAGQAISSNELVTCSGSLHGAAMLTGVKDLSGVIFGWLENVLLTPLVSGVATNGPASIPPASQPVPGPKAVESNYHR